MYMGGGGGGVILWVDLGELRSKGRSDLDPIFSSHNTLQVAPSLFHLDGPSSLSISLSRGSLPRAGLEGALLREVKIK